MKFSDSHAAVVISDNQGVYIAQVFAQLYENELRKAGYKETDIQILLAGPDHEHYQECWSELFPCELTGSDGKIFVFDNVGDSGDIWEIPKEEYQMMEWED